MLAALAPGAALGQTVEQALELETQGRLGDALDAFQAALTREGNSREDLSTIYLHLSVLHFGSGDQESARQALHRLRAVAPEATLPDSAPPEIVEIFEQVSSVWGDRRLRGDLTGPGQVGADVEAEVRLHVIDDVAGLVAGAELLLDDEVLFHEPGRGPYTFTVNPSELGRERLLLTCRLLDDQGGVVWQGGALEVTVSASAEGGDQGEAEGAEAGDQSSTRRLRVAGWVLLGASVLAGGAAATLLALDGRPTGEVRIVGAQSEDEYYNTDLAGWVTLGVAVAGLTTSLVLLLVRRRSGGQEASRPALVARSARWWW